MLHTSNDCLLGHAAWAPTCASPSKAAGRGRGRTTAASPQPAALASPLKERTASASPPRYQPDGQWGRCATARATSAEGQCAEIKGTTPSDRCSGIHCCIRAPEGSEHGSVCDCGDAWSASRRGATAAEQWGGAQVPAPLRRRNRFRARCPTTCSLSTWSLMQPWLTRRSTGAAT